jgi:hypothetical protein
MRVHTGTGTAITTSAAALPGVVVVTVASSLWAVYDPRSDVGGLAVGHIEYDDDRFGVSTNGDPVEAYTFGSMQSAADWFTEYLFALTLGDSSAPVANQTCEGNTTLSHQPETG